MWHTYSESQLPFFQNAYSNAGKVGYKVCHIRWPLKFFNFFVHFAMTTQVIVCQSPTHAHAHLFSGYHHHEVHARGPRAKRGGAKTGRSVRTFSCLSINNYHNHLRSKIHHKMYTCTWLLGWVGKGAPRSGFLCMQDEITQPGATMNIET